MTDPIFESDAECEAFIDAADSSRHASARDTERIEWLEAQMARMKLIPDRGIGMFRATMGFHLYAPHFANDLTKFPHATVREAIDAAMQAEPAHE